MGNICNIFFNENLYQKDLNISTPQFIIKGIPIENTYNDLSNSLHIQIPSAHTFLSNYLDDIPIYVNSSSNNSLINSYYRPQSAIVHHYYYKNNNDNDNINNNNNDNMSKFLLLSVLFSELELVDEL